MRVIVLEDDLQIAPDFHEYFKALAPVYDEDPTVFCVSGWNDNGMKTAVSDPSNLLRTDVFPGLGWMINLRVWQELEPKWPLAFWDDWMREKAQPKGRTCIFPEINRVYTFGDRGNSVDNSFWNKFLKPIKLNSQFTRFSELPLDYIKMPQFARKIEREVKQAREMKVDQIQTAGASDTVLIRYENEQQFRTFSRTTGIQPEFKNGDPRASFKHINLAYVGGKKTYIVDGTILDKIRRGDQSWFL